MDIHPINLTSQMLNIFYNLINEKHMLQIEISMGKQGIYCYPTFYQNFNSHFNEVSPLSPSYSIDSFTYNTQASWLVRSVQLLNQLRKQEEEIRLPWSFFPEWRLVRTWSRTWKKNRGLSSKASIIRDVDGHYFNVHGPQLLGLVSHVPITKGPVQRTLGCSGILKTTRSNPIFSWASTISNGQIR